MLSDVDTEVRKDDVRVDLHGKSAIVTGAATGIGSAIAERFARAGARVTIDIPPDAKEGCDAQEVFEKIRKSGGTAQIVAADVSKEADANALIESAVEKFGKIDILVNNAGVEESHPVVEMPLETWERILRINLTGAFLCARAAAREMIRQKHGGRILMISSVHEKLAMPKNAAYTASKGGLRMFMRTLALELAPHGITVNDIAPGAIATRMNRNVRTDTEEHEQLLAEIPLGRIGDVNEVAALATYLASDAAAYITGASYIIDGGLAIFTKGL